MRLFKILIAGSLLISGLAMADQTDDRLEGLFEVLKQAEGEGVIRTTENRIWEIWYQHPNPDVERLMQLGEESMNRREYSESLLIFSNIIDSFPEFAEAWNRRATLYYVAGNLDASIADIEKTLELEPRHFGALSGLGLVYIQRKELSKAKQAFEHLVEVHPNSPNAKENLEAVIEQLNSSVI